MREYSLPSVFVLAPIIHRLYAIGEIEDDQVPGFLPPTHIERKPRACDTHPDEEAFSRFQTLTLINSIAAITPQP